MAIEYAAPSKAKPPPEQRGESNEPSSLPASRASLASTVVAVLLLFYTFYFAAPVLVPIAAAVLLSMLLAPVVQLLERLRIPRMPASAIVVLSVVCLLVAGMIALAGPAKIWVERTAQSLQTLEHKFRTTTKPIEDIKKATGQIKEAAVAADPPVQEVRVAGPAIGDLLLSATPRVAGSVLSTTILVYFLLVTGDVFLRKLVNVIPTFRDKKRAVDITRQIETDISFYLLNFTLVNVGLGVAVAIVTALLGLPNPLLWGVLVAVLNFVPYVGAMVSMVMLAMVGLQTFDSVAQALVAPAILAGLVAISAEVVTPYVLGRGLLLNPVAIFIAIMLWGWLWGIVGVLLAVPLLASFKIICERVEPLNPLAEFLTP